MQRGEVLNILPQSSGDFDPEADPELKISPDRSEISIQRNFRKHHEISMIRSPKLLIRNENSKIRGKFFGRTVGRYFHFRSLREFRERWDVACELTKTSWWWVVPHVWCSTTSTWRSVVTVVTILIVVTAGHVVVVNHPLMCVRCGGRAMLICEYLIGKKEVGRKWLNFWPLTNILPTFKSFVFYFYYWRVTKILTD